MNESVIKLVEWFSEKGLRESVEDHKQSIKDKQKEIEKVAAGELYNPLCKEGWIICLTKEIEEIKLELKDFEAALEMKLEKNKKSFEIMPIQLSENKKKCKRCENSTFTHFDNESGIHEYCKEGHCVMCVDKKDEECLDYQKINTCNCIKDYLIPTTNDSFHIKFRSGYEYRYKIEKEMYFVYNELNDVFQFLKVDFSEYFKEIISE